MTIQIRAWDKDWIAFSEVEARAVASQFDAFNNMNYPSRCSNEHDRLVGSIRTIQNQLINNSLLTSNIDLPQLSDQERTGYVYTFLSLDDWRLLPEIVRGVEDFERTCQMVQAEDHELQAQAAAIVAASETPTSAATSSTDTTNSFSMDFSNSYGRSVGLVALGVLGLFAAGFYLARKKE